MDSQCKFFRNKQHSFLKSRRFLWKKRIVTWLFEGKQDIIGNKSIHQVYAFIKSKRKSGKQKEKSEKRETVRMRGNDWTKGKTGCNDENSGSNQKTGLSRRTVYYYIDQKMISPVVDEHNGYHDFQKQIFKNFLSSASCARQDFHWRISARFFTSRAQHHFICINS